MKQKILVLGEGGFIGGNLIRKFIYDKLPYEFVGIDNINHAPIGTIYSKKNRIFYIADICDENIMDKIIGFEKPNIIIHSATENNNQNKFIQTNISGTDIVVKAAVKWGVERFIYLSTGQVYGETPRRRENGDGTLATAEETETTPLTAFSSSKLAGELLLRAYTRGSKTTFNIIRSSNVYGPRQYVSKLIPTVIKCILENQQFPVYGKGMKSPPVRDYLYVDDFSNAIYKIITHGIKNETYNVSSQDEISNVEVIQKICNIMGRGHNLIDFIEGDNDAHTYTSDSSKIRETLGWKNEIKLKEGLTNTINWFINNSWALKE